MKIQDRNWKGRLSEKNILEVHAELVKIFKESCHTVVMLCVTGEGLYTISSSTQEEITLSNLAQDYSFSLHLANYVNCVSVRAYVIIEHNKVIIKQLSASGNQLHWEFIKEEKPEAILTKETLVALVEDRIPRVHLKSFIEFISKDINEWVQSNVNSFLRGD